MGYDASRRSRIEDEEEIVLYDFVFSFSLISLDMGETYIRLVAILTGI